MFVLGFALPGYDHMPRQPNTQPSGERGISRSSRPAQAKGHFAHAVGLVLCRELRGKVLIYDFWTYCCINCIHILPALSNLEQRYSGQAVAIVGIHSAKFDNEKVGMQSSLSNKHPASVVLCYELPCHI